jgi:hypothetical protein
MNMVDLPRHHDPPGHPPRLLRLSPRPHRRDRQVHRRPERPLRALHLDQGHNLPTLSDDPDALFDTLAAEMVSWPVRPAADHFRALSALLSPRTGAAWSGMRAGFSCASSPAGAGLTAALEAALGGAPCGEACATAVPAIRRVQVKKYRSQTRGAAGTAESARWTAMWPDGGLCRQTGHSAIATHRS